MAPGQPVLAPRGSVREGSAARWFRRHAEGVFDVDDVVARAADLAGLVAEARAAYALGDREILAVGFSNGANMALATTLLHPSALTSTIAFSARWPLGDREPAADLSGARITLLNGDADAMAPLVDVERTAREADARGADVSSHVRPGGHGLDARDLDAARARIRTH
nr:carboxylesterase [Clavibacter michiganensis]